MRVLTGIVLYNPDIDRLKENIDAVSLQCNNILLIDNASKNIEQIKEVISQYLFFNIEIIQNDINKGIATALKQIMKYAAIYEYDWVLTLDQDSVIKNNLIKIYQKYTTLPRAGILSCNIIDRNFMESSGFKENELYKDIKTCITSGSFVNSKAYLQTEGFDEKMFIDWVDFDMCINMRKHGYKIIKINFDGILHEVGHGKNVRLLFKNYIVYNHLPFRQYYMARNHLYVIRKYPKEYSFVKECIREIIDQFLIVIYENNKMEKIINRWKGIKDAFKMSI